MQLLALLLYCPAEGVATGAIGIMDGIA